MPSCNLIAYQCILESFQLFTPLLSDHNHNKMTFNLFDGKNYYRCMPSNIFQVFNKDKNSKFTKKDIIYLSYVFKYVIKTLQKEKQNINEHNYTIVLLVRMNDGSCCFIKTKLCQEDIHVCICTCWCL